MARKKAKKSSKSKSIPTNKALYAKVKAEAKRKFIKIIFLRMTYY